MKNEELINRLRDVPCWAIGTETEETMLEVACALEASEKRIVELEAKLAEAENSIKNYKDLYLSRKREELLLAQQIPKEGEWTVYPINDFMNRRTGNHRIVCKCGYEKTLWYNDKLPTFCENCGAKMRKGAE